MITCEYDVFRTAVVREVAAVLTKPHILFAPGSPVVGALLDALADGDEQLTARGRQRLANAALPADLLQT